MTPNRIAVWKHCFAGWIALTAALSVGSAQAQGVTNETILIGQSAALSGPAQELGKEMKAGAEAYFNYVNKKGGIYGRQIKLISLDDGYEPDRAAANTKKLIEEHHVLALFGYVGTPTSNAALPIFTEAKVPFIGPFTGAQSLREPFNRNIFHVRASYFDETEAIIDHLVRQGISRIGVFYQNDAYGKAGLAGVERALKARNLNIVASATVERNSVDVAKAVETLAPSKTAVIVMISAYKSCASFIKAMKKAGATQQYWNVSFVGSKALAAELGDEGRGVQISQVVPFPWSETVPVVAEYQARIGGPESYSFTSLEGYLAAKVLVEGLRRAGKNPTREGLIDKLSAIGKLDLGGFIVSYSGKDHSGSKYVDLTIISKNKTFKR